MIANPSAATPTEIDTALAELDHAAERVRERRARAWATIHDVCGSTRRTRGYGRVREERTMTDAQALEATKAALAALEAYFAEHGNYIDAPGPMRSSRIFNAKQAMALLPETAAERARIDAAIAPLEAEYARRPWARFYLVISSAGHIHASRNCSTCRPTTRYGWVPKLAGSTEADAVAEVGPALCSVCFKSAPAEYQVGKVTKAQAAKLAA